MNLMKSVSMLNKVTQINWKNQKSVLLSFFLLFLIALILKSNTVILVFLIMFFSIQNHSSDSLENITSKFLILFCFTELTFILPITNTQRAVVGIILLLIQSRISKKLKFSSRSAIKTTIMFIGLSGVYYLILKKPDRIIQFLLYGYDNAFHFSLYRLYALSEQFPNQLNQDWSSDFVLFKNYSGGFYALASFLSSSIAGSTDDGIRLIAAYFLILVTMCAGVIVFSMCLLKSLSKNQKLGILNFLVALAFFASIGVLLTNGYPPYIYACLILILLITRIHKSRDFAVLLGWSSLAFHLMIIGQPLVSWNLIPFFLFLFVFFCKKVFSHKFSKHDFYAVVLSAILGCITFLMVANTTSSFGVSTLNAVGGVQTLNTAYWITNLIVLIITLCLAVFQKTNLTSLIMSVSVSVPFLFLIFITLHSTGIIGYYAIKQGYIWSYLLGLSAILLYQNETSKSAGNNKQIQYFFLNILIILVMFGSLLGAINPTGSSSPFMGTLKNVVLASTGDKSFWSTTGLDANQLIFAANTSRHLEAKCLVYKRGEGYGDLGSRWLNALASKSTSEACFSVYWNSDLLSEKEVKVRILISGTSVKIVSIGQIP